MKYTEAEVKAMVIKAAEVGAREALKSLGATVRKDVDVTNPGTGPIVARRRDFWGDGESLIARELQSDAQIIHHSPRLDELVDEAKGVRRSGHEPDTTPPQGPMERMVASGGTTKVANQRAMEKSALFGPLVKRGGLEAGGSSGSAKLAKAIANVSTGTAFRKGQTVEHRFTRATSTVLESNQAFTLVEYSEGDTAQHLTAALKAV